LHIKAQVTEIERIGVSEQRFVSRCHGVSD
jgi:hypothetical protein